MPYPPRTVDSSHKENCDIAKHSISDLPTGGPHDDLRLLSRPWVVCIDGSISSLRIGNELYLGRYMRRQLLSRPACGSRYYGAGTAVLDSSGSGMSRTMTRASSSRSPRRNHSGAMRMAIRSMERSTIHLISCSGGDRAPPSMIVVPFGNPGIPPPGFLFWRKAALSLAAPYFASAKRPTPKTYC